MELDFEFLDLRIVKFMICLGRGEMEFLDMFFFLYLFIGKD